MQNVINRPLLSLFLAFAFFIDLGAYFGGGYGNRGRVGR
jgi:hypothetical protein